MSVHWSLAVRGALVAVALALLAALVLGYHSGPAHSGAFLYGVGVGVVSFVSIALAVSMLTVRPTGLRVLFGATFYVGRLVFAAAAVLVPVYLGAWPALPMLGGLAGVYAVENVVVVLLASKSMGAGPKGVERRAEA